MDLDKFFLILAELDDPTFFRRFIIRSSHVWFIQLDNDYTGLISPVLQPSLAGYDVDSNVNSVAVNQVIYKSVDNLAGVISTLASYYYDRPNRILYVHFQDNKTPYAFTDSEVKINLILGFYKTNAPIDIFDGVLIGQQYIPKLGSTGKIKTSKDDPYVGKQRFENNSIEILDGDYEFKEYNIGPNNTQKHFGGLVKIKAFFGDNITSIDYDNDLVTNYQGRIRNITESSTLRLELTDLRKQYDKKFPNETFDRISHNLNDSGLTENPFIQDIWGEARRVPVQCLNKDLVFPTISNYTFLVCSSRRTLATTAISEIYIDGVLKSGLTATPYIIDNAYFIDIPTSEFSKLDEDSNVVYEGMEKVSLTIDGYRDSSFNLITSGLGILQAILEDSYGILLTDVYYQDPAVFQTQINESPDIAYVVTKPTPVYKQLEEIQDSLVGYMLIDPDLKLFWETDDETAPVIEFFQDELLGVDYIPEVTQDPTNVLSVIRVGHSKKWDTSRYDYNVDSSNEDNALTNYNSREQRDFNTLLYQPTDITSFIQKISPFSTISFDTVRFSILLTAETALLKAGDWIRANLDLPTKVLYGRTALQIQSTNQNLDSMTLDIVGRIMWFGDDPIPAVWWNKLDDDTTFFNNEIGAEALVKQGTPTYAAAKWTNGVYCNNGPNNFRLPDISTDLTKVGNFIEAFTFDFWFKYTDYSVTNGIASAVHINPNVPFMVNDAAFSNFLSLQHSNSASTATTLYVRDGIGGTADLKMSTLNIALNELVNWRFVYDTNGIDGGSDTVALYKGGVKIVSTSVAFHYDVSATTKIEWGNHGNISADRPALGVIDNIRMWDFGNTNFEDLNTEAPLGS
jgi:hypothetical protein